MFIEVIDLKKSIGEFKLSIENLEFREGKLHIIEGNNGSGKTTLLNIICNLLIQDDGKIIYDKKEMKGNEFYIKNRIGFLPNIISLPDAYNKDITSDIFKSQFINFSKKKFEECLTNLNINTNKSVGDMSDGMKKKFMLATVLSYYPEVLICDEPFNDIDRDAHNVLLVEFNKILQRNGTVIISTHIKDLLNEFNPVIIRMKEGQLVKD